MGLEKGRARAYAFGVRLLVGVVRQMFPALEVINEHTCKALGVTCAPLESLHVRFRFKINICWTLEKESACVKPHYSEQIMVYSQSSRSSIQNVKCHLWIKLQHTQTFGRGCGASRYLFYLS
jgi:hypothetical protein